jgi:hypothetical protein
MQKLLRRRRIWIHLSVRCSFEKVVRPRGKQRRLTRVKYNIAFENKGTGTPLSMGGNNGFSPRRLNQESSGARRIAVQKQLALSVAVGADDGRHHVRENGRQKEVRRRRKAPAHRLDLFVRPIHASRRARKATAQRTINRGR